MFRRYLQASLAFVMTLAIIVFIAVATQATPQEKRFAAECKLLREQFVLPSTEIQCEWSRILVGIILSGDEIDFNAWYNSLVELGLEAEQHPQEQTVSLLQDHVAAIRYIGKTENVSFGVGLYENGGHAIAAFVTGRNALDNAVIFGCTAGHGFDLSLELLPSAELFETCVVMGTALYGYPTPVHTDPLGLQITSFKNP